jgi:hypothetical protein
MMFWEGKDPFAWKKVKPKPGESLVKTVKGKKYNWCSKHQAWTIHTPKNCPPNTKKKKDIALDHKIITADTQFEQEPALTISEALQAITETLVFIHNRSVLNINTLHNIQ